MPDPRKYDLVVRSTITGAIALIIVVVAAIEAIQKGHVDQDLAAWGGIIIGVFFGSHASLNGSGVRAARDQQMTKELLEATTPSAAATPAAQVPVKTDG